jgi:hypothetical protein
MNLKESIIALIDKATEPAAMGKEGAVEFLDDLKDELSSRIEALNEEILNEELVTDPEEIDGDED